MSRSTRTVTIELAIDAEILDAAIASGTDIALAAQDGIIGALNPASRGPSEKARLWREENAEAIESLNRHVEERGMPMSRYRRYPWPDTTPT